MLNHRIQLTTLLIIAMLTPFSAASPDLWRLDSDQNWTEISPQDKFLVAVAQVKNLVNTGQVEPARRAYEKLKTEFPEIAGADLDAFIEAEMLFSEGKFTKAYRAYEKILRDQPQSRLLPAVLDRQFAIGTAYLGGQSRHVMKVIKLKGDAEGVRIMEKITDNAGIQSPLGLRASLAIARNYNKRQMHNEEYLKWWEISLEYKTGQLAKNALLGMAASKHAIYNRQPEEKRAFYDPGNLRTAQSHYKEFMGRYPQDAEKLGTNQIIKQIDEQLAEKELVIAQYYDRTSRIQAANLYYDMVLQDYPQTKAAEAAKQERAGIIQP
jgi:tetratricopeptide (TPR) repeat protein